MKLRNMLYTGILLAGSAVAALLSGCASTQSSSIDRMVLDSLRPKNAVMKQEGQPDKTGKKYLNGGLDGLVSFEINYQKGQRQKVPHAETELLMDYNEEDGWTFNNSKNDLINLTPQKESEVVELLNQIKTNTYTEFTNRLSQLNEKQITLVLSTLARFALCKNYNSAYNQDSEGFSKADAEHMYNLIKGAVTTDSIDEDIACRQIHNFISETARKSGLPEAIVFSCETKNKDMLLLLSGGLMAQ